MNRAFGCSCDPPKRAFISPFTSIRARPSCHRCGERFTKPLEAHWQVRPGCTIADVNITPELAQEWLPQGKSVEGPNNPRVVASHAEKMRNGSWKNLTLEMGGIYHPILFDENGYIRYGLQRLEACVKANTPFTAVVVRWDGKEITDA